jgi:DNA-binding transcriptional regulator YiaG
MVRPNAWQQLYLNEESGARQFGYFSRKLIENIDWANEPAAGDLAIELLKYVRFQNGGQPRDLKVGTMLGDICGLGQAKESWKQTRNRQKLERAILEQERWGWNVEWTRWPDAYRPDRENRPDFPDRWWQGNKKADWKCSFQDWKVTFYPPEDLAEMNSRAQKIDNSAPHELEPTGWPDRIKAILETTNYSQAGLAKTVEVSASAISRWKSGDRTPGPEHRAKLRDIERRNELLDS